MNIYIYVCACVRVCVCVCVCTYKNICIFIYTHTYIHIHIYTYIHIYIYSYIHMYIYIHTCIHPYIYTICMHVCICMYTFIHLYIYTFIHTYIHTYTLKCEHLPTGELVVSQGSRWTFWKRQLPMKFDMRLALTFEKFTFHITHALHITCTFRIVDFMLNASRRSVYVCMYAEGLLLSSCACWMNTAWMQYWRI
jgi:hypothetical protein